MNQPSVRLAFVPAGGMAGMGGAPSVRLAYLKAACDSAIGESELIGGWLVSYYYLDGFLKVQPDYLYRDWVMDSGAFSAHNSGVVIDLPTYIGMCGRLLDNDKTLAEVYALDVIGDHEASLINTETMWEHGIPAIPCYHAGEPWEFLVHIAKHYPKIAIGGVARKGTEVKMKFAEQCFARVWPKKIHGFGMAGEELVMGFPFHSVDSTSWEMGPMAFGNWFRFGKMDARAKAFPDGKFDLRSQIKAYLKLEAKARERWRKEMAVLETLDK